MDTNFWHERWSDGRIGFHQSQANPMLVKHWQSLGIGADIPVFVPLCGKSLDLIWLRQQGHDVTGVELNRSAIEAFDRENSLNGSWTEVGGLPLYRAKSLRIWQADIFSLSNKHIAPLQAIFDRAALIALPNAMRTRYSKHLHSLSAANCQQLLVCLEYDQSQREGPPFSVARDHVEALYPQWSKKKLSTELIAEKTPASKDTAYHLRRNGQSGALSGTKEL